MHASKVLPACCCHSRPEHRASHLHVRSVERTHDCLDPVVVDFDEEEADGLLGLRAGWVGTDSCRDAAGRGRCSGCGLVQEKEFDVAASDEA